MLFDTAEEDLMTLEDLCYRLKMSESTAYQLLRTGEIKAFPVGKRWKIPADAVRKFIREHTPK